MKMPEDINQEFEDLLKLGEKAGINELIEVYSSFHDYAKISNEYLQQFEPKYYLSTTNFTYSFKED